MKATLEFNLPEEQDLFEAAVAGQKTRDQLDSIWEKLFRPAFKNGYSGLHAEDLNAYVNSGEDGKDVITMLSEIYQELVRDF